MTSTEDSEPSAGMPAQESARAQRGRKLKRLARRTAQVAFACIGLCILLMIAGGISHGAPGSALYSGWIAGAVISLLAAIILFLLYVPIALLGDRMAPDERKKIPPLHASSHVQRLIMSGRKSSARGQAEVESVLGLSVDEIRAGGPEQLASRLIALNAPELNGVQWACLQELLWYHYATRHEEHWRLRRNACMSKGYFETEVALERRGASVLLGRQMSAAALVRCLDSAKKQRRKPVKCFEPDLAVAGSVLTRAIGIAGLGSFLFIKIGIHAFAPSVTQSGLLAGLLIAAGFFIVLSGFLRWLRHRRAAWMLALSDHGVRIWRPGAQAEARTVSMDECVVLEPSPVLPESAFRKATPDLRLYLMLQQEPLVLYAANLDIRGTMWERWIREFAAEEALLKAGGLSARTRLA